MSIKENLLDVCQLQWCAADPYVQKILRKYLLPKRPKEPLPEKVINLLATPRVLKETVYESDSEVEGEAESEEKESQNVADNLQEMESESEEEMESESEEESEAESEADSEQEMDQD